MFMYYISSTVACFVCL